MSTRDRNPQIYIAKLSPSVREKDLAEKFEKYGDIRKIQVKTGYAFIEYYDSRDAEYAVYKMDGRTFEGEKIVVQPSMGKRRDRNEFRDRGDRERGERGDRGDSRERRRADPDRKRGPQPEDICFNCGGKGHWTNECGMPKKPR